MSGTSFLKGLFGFGSQPKTHALDGDKFAREAQRRTGIAVGAALRAYSGTNYAGLSERAQNTLHKFGDVFAHVDADGSHYPGGIGHAGDGTSPDNIFDLNTGGLSAGAEGYARAAYRLFLSSGGGGRAMLSEEEFIAKIRNAAVSPLEEHQAASLNGQIEAFGGIPVQPAVDVHPKLTHLGL